MGNDWPSESDSIAGAEFIYTHSHTVKTKKGEKKKTLGNQLDFEYIQLVEFFLYQLNN